MKKPNWAAFSLIIIFVLVVAVVLSYFFITSKRKQNENETLSGRVNNYEVLVYKDKFVPATIQIENGAQVTWLNKDSADRRVVVDPHPLHNGLKDFDSGVLRSGASFSFLFDKTGTFTYHLEENPLVVKGMVIVR